MYLTSLPPAVRMYQRICDGGYDRNGGLMTDIIVIVLWYMSHLCLEVLNKSFDLYIRIMFCLCYELPHGYQTRDSTSEGLLTASEDKYIQPQHIYKRHVSSTIQIFINHQSINPQRIG